MASRQSTVDFIVEQIARAANVSARKMFGEYALFCEGKLVALICEDELFIKPTAAGRAHVGEPMERPPYKGAKPYLLIDADAWDDAEWLDRLIRVTAAELPLPKPKKPKAAKTLLQG